MLLKLVVEAGAGNAIRATVDDEADGAREGESATRGILSLLELSLCSECKEAGADRISSKGTQGGERGMRILRLHWTAPACQPTAC